MISWHINNIRTYRPADPTFLLTEEIKFAISGHAASSVYNPRSFFSRKSILTHPEIDIDPSKPQEQEQERVERFIDENLPNDHDHLLILEVTASIPNDEYQLVKNEMGISDPDIQQAPIQFKSLKELIGALLGSGEYDPESGITSEEFAKDKKLTEALREYLRNNPPMHGENENVVPVQDEDGVTISRVRWLTEVVGPWIAEGIPGLPYGVVKIAAEPMRARRDVAPGQVIPFQGKIWVVGKGVYTLGGRDPKSGSQIIFGKDPRGSKRAKYKQQYDPEQQKIVSTSEPTTRARQEIEGAVVEYITGRFQYSRHYKNKLIEAIKTFFGITDGLLDKLVYGENNEHVQIWQYQGAAQAESDENSTNILLGVTIQLGDEAFQDNSTLFGYINTLWSDAYASGMMLHKPQWNALKQHKLTDLWIFRTSLEGLPRIYGAISASGQSVRKHFGTTAETFWEELEEGVFGLAPGDTDHPNFPGAKGAFKEVRVRDNGDILFLFATPELADPIPLDKPSASQASSGATGEGDISSMIKGAEREVKRRFQMVKPGTPEEPDQLNVPLRDRPTVPRNPETIEKYKRTSQPTEICSLCNGTGSKVTRHENESGQIEYNVEECPQCKGTTWKPAGGKASPEAQAKDLELEKAAYQKVLQNDQLKRLIPAIRSLKVSRKEKIKLILNLARHADALASGEKIPGDPFPDIEKMLAGEESGESVEE